MGNDVLMVFSVTHASDAIAALQTTQSAATDEWHPVDTRCRVVIKVGVERVLSGVFGPPVIQQDDIFGDALNRLFRFPAADVEIAPGLLHIVG